MGWLRVHVRQFGRRTRFLRAWVDGAPPPVSRPWTAKVRAIELYTRPRWNGFSDKDATSRMYMEGDGTITADWASVTPNGEIELIIGDATPNVYLAMKLVNPLMPLDAQGVQPIAARFHFDRTIWPGLLEPTQPNPSELIYRQFALEPFPQLGLRAGTLEDLVPGGDLSGQLDLTARIGQRLAPAVLYDGFGALTLEREEDLSQRIDARPRLTFFRTVDLWAADSVYPKEPTYTWTLRLRAGCANWHPGANAAGIGELTHPPVLWPFGLAAHGERNDGRSFDFECAQVPPPPGGPPPGTWWLDSVHSNRPDGTNVDPFPDHECVPLRAWNRAIADPYLRALKAVKGGSPTSLVPRFRDVDPLEQSPQLWRARYWARPTPAGPQLFDLEVRGLANLTTPRFLEAIAQFPNFGDSTGAPLLRKLSLPQAEWTEGATTLALSDAGALESPGLFRVGALDLTMSRAKMSQSDTSENSPHPEQVLVSFVPALLRSKGDRLQLEGAASVGAAHVHREPNVHVRLSLPLASFEPAGQDPLRTELDFDANLKDAAVREQPLVRTFSSAGPAAGPETALYFRAEEKTGPGDTQSLTLRLLKTTDSKIAIDLLVIDPEPLMIARVTGELPADHEVGDWSNDRADGDSWRLRDSQDPFSVFLPPQGIGEEAIKRYKPPDSKPAKPEEEPFYLNPDKPLHYRFSPPAELKLRRAGREQNFTEPPWNLRRMLGDVEPELHGRPAEEVNFELLFGLSASIQESKTSPLKLRVSELAPMLGLPPPLLEEPVKREKAGVLEERLRQAFITAMKSYRAAYQRQRKRLAVLKPWSQLQPGAGHFESSKQVSYRFRAGRKTVDPVRPGGTESPWDPAKHEWRLRGGVDWGFESSKLHEEVTSSGDSSSGKIVDPWFTALGGGGFQKASFALDKTTIYSNTQLGRTDFYSLERIGRIGVLWNRAKHVIVYERSVVASPQFPDERLGKDRRPEFEGKPVLRKVREYVEILQKERSYPEHGEPANVRGFVEGAKVEHTIIPVDSRWGWDVPTGWVVPLWNPAVAQKGVYEPPDIHLKLASARDAQQVWGRVLNPEDLVFYTSTLKEEGVDTDVWAPAAGVDFTPEDLPAVTGSPNDDSGRVTDAPQANAPRRAAGYEAFTWRLDTGGARVNLLAGRFEQVTEALIENVSLSRRNLGPCPRHPDLETVGAAAAGAAAFTQAFEDGIAPALENLDGAGAKAEQLANDARVKISSAQAAFQTWLDATEKKDVFRERFELERTQWAALARLSSTKFRQKIEDELAAYRLRPHEASRQQVLRLLWEWQTQLQSVPAFDDELVSRVRTTVRELDEQARALSDTAKEVGKQLERIRQEALRLGDNALEHYRTLALVEVVRVRQALTVARERMSSSHPRELAQLAQTVEQAFDTALSSLWVEDPSPQWLDTLDPARVMREFSSAAATACGDRAAEITKGDLAKLEEAALAFRKKLEAPLGELETLAGELFKGFETANTELNALMNAAQTIETAAKDELDNLRGALSSVVDNAAGSLLRVGEGLQAELDGFKSRAETIARWARGSAEAQVRQHAVGLMRGMLGGVQEGLEPWRRAAHDFRSLKLEQLEQLPSAVSLGAQTLRLVRAFGDAPVAEAMRLSREKIAYFFHELGKDGARVLPAVDFTPSRVLMNRLGKELEQLDLKSLGIRLPSKSLGEQFIAELVPKTMLRDIIPDVAGLNLAGLFEGVAFPRLPEAVRVTHGVDPRSRLAWAACDVDVPLESDARVFQLGPFDVRLRAGSRLEARTRIEATLDSAPVRQVNAAVIGAWQLNVGGQTVVSLEKTAVRFDRSGRLRFELSPANVRLHSAVQFVSDLLSQVKPGESGLKLDLLRGASGLPSGVRASLALALPALQFGAFSVSNLSLGARFELAVESGFRLDVGLSISSKERPFNLSVLCLGGGGWISTAASYRLGGSISANLSIGISAGASLPFDIGVARGGVYVLASIAIEWSSGAGNGLTFLLRIAISGELVILGIISVGVLLALEAEYQSGSGSLVGRGMLRVSIKIGWFFKISISKTVEFRLAGAPPPQPALAAFGGDDPVDHYVATFGVD